MHYHKKNIEAFYIVSGKVKYKCKSVFSKENEEEKEFTEGAFWSVKPYVGHDFYFLKDTILVSMYSMGVDLSNGTRDIIEVEDI